MTQVLVHNIEKVFLKPIITNQRFLRMPYDFFASIQDLQFKADDRRFYAGLLQENFEDLPRDQCSDESLRRAQVWQRFLHSDDEHIKVDRFCLICGHAEDWEKLSLGLKMKMRLNHHYHYHYELTSLICLGVILLPLIGHFRPILFQVSSRWYVASSRAAGNSARCTPCTDPRPVGIGVIDPGGVEIHKRSQWKQWKQYNFFYKNTRFCKMLFVYDHVCPTIIVQYWFKMIHRLYFIEQFYGILEFIKLCESTHSWGDRVAWNVCCQVSDVLPLRGVLQDTATCLHCDKRRKRIGATNVWHNDFLAK